MAAAMLVFGTIGLFVKNIGFPSSFISFARALTGSIFIALFMLFSGHGLDKKSVLKNLKLLIPSGIAMAFNWICLFEAYRFTGVAVGTLCYYMAPVIVLVLSPVFLKEKLTVINVTSVLAAVVGAVLISGVVSGSAKSAKGILFGLAAAALYSTVVMINKFVKNLSPIETTFVQLSTAAVAMIPYILLTEDITTFVFDRRSVIFTLIVGVFHTGIVYMIYFSSVQKIPAQTTAVFSYIDPVTAIILSAVVLGERLDAVQLIGTFLILTATLFNELAPIIRKKGSSL
ncbi:MAG: DMT family transporter [Clostridiaceae bacterium]|nr:DMT family transporter [Clostridiaceae bacterium]MDY5888859.1 DMT family transporter [Oscillospiraceae bacterium]